MADDRPAHEMPDDLIAEAITEAFGERCNEYDARCHCCRAWAQYDALMAKCDTLPEPRD